MADYSVDIAVAVKGSQQLKKLRTEISNTSKELTVLNKLANKQSKTLPNSFQTLTLEEMIGWAAFAELEDEEYKKQQEVAQRSSALRGRKR